MIDNEAAARAWLVDALGADQTALERLERLVAMLAEENQRQNLVARASLDHVWQRHIVDSAQLLSVSRGTAVGEGAWLDLGTGAGFPGLVIAAMQPTREVVVVDSRRLRTEWLARAADALGLDRVRVVLSKVEDLPTRAHAVISARAFAPLERLLSLSARFSTPQTLWLLPKGAKARHELQELGKGWRHTFHVEQSLTDAAAGVLVGHLLGAPTTNDTAQVRNSTTGHPARKGARP
ncbi:16S rRNA (guanine(527)-N(7))-methyltransferase RsmG [Novosphingobium sp. Fuku2-ISO-50]|uniref:16S rRNA (guanine(527)-N(7))-methyltransferase RsmG n=1 Tax=Novosphingobium sp. Fuku2-ISO-50 TaxID=1739114 RepID=UPI0009E73C33|nr:16S rRNA (guanine(527)-N(7))-methyltransferase RsmG [Novosphingobium sp. Fuku2-ISO-50]